MKPCLISVSNDTLPYLLQFLMNTYLSSSVSNENPAVSSSAQTETLNFSSVPNETLSYLVMKTPITIFCSW